jgi:hypothetical protein
MASKTVVRHNVSRFVHPSVGVPDVDKYVDGGAGIPTVVEAVPKAGWGWPSHGILVVKVDIVASKGVEGSVRVQFAISHM